MCRRVVSLVSLLPSLSFKRLIKSLLILAFLATSAHSFAITFTHKVTGNDVELTWSGGHTRIELFEIRNGSDVSILHQNGGSGTITYTKPAGRHYFKIKDYLSSWGGNILQDTKNVTAIVALPEPTVNISLDKTTLYEGQSATLSWNSTNANYCVGTNLSGVNSTSGTNGKYYAPTSLATNVTETVKVKCVGDGGSAEKTASMSVLAVNDSPTISNISNQSVNEDNSTGNISFAIGDEETSTSSLSLSSSHNNTNLIQSISFGGSGSNRTVKVVPKTNASGSATVTVTVKDGGNKTQSDSFVFTVNAVNDSPSLGTISPVSIDEGTASTTRDVSVNDVETSNGSLSVSYSSSNTALIPTSRISTSSISSGNARRITLQPVAEQVGSSTITVTLSDGSLTHSRSFEFTVNDRAAVLSVPSTDSDGNFNVEWNYANGQHRILKNGTTPITSGGNGLTTDYSGSVSQSVSSNQTISYTLQKCRYQSEAGLICGNVSTKSITVTFAKPVITASFDQSQINESGSTIFRWTASDADSCSATGVSGVSDTSGNVNYTAPSNMSVDQSVSVTVTCNGRGGSTSKSVSLSVKAVNDAPTISNIANQSINEDASLNNLSFSIGDEETSSGALNVTATHNNTNLIQSISFGGSNGSRTISVTPKANAHGQATITATVTDAGGKTKNDSFVLTVNPVNDAPTITAISDQELEIDSQVSLSFNVSDLETSSGSLSVQAESSNLSLLPAGGLQLSGGGASRTLLIKPQPGKRGQGQVSLLVTDGAKTSEVSFGVFVGGKFSEEFDFAAEAPSEFTASLDAGVFDVGDGELVAVTEGVLNVANGASTYSIPIDLPPSVRNLAPKLSLAYSSMSPGGIAGVGWGVSGLSSIARCPASFAVDGVEAQKSNPRYTNGDRLCLNGKKLMLASQSSPANDSDYWGVGAKYVAEREDFSEIQAYGSHNGAHAYFKVKLKSGLTLTYGEEGENQNSRGYPAGRSDLPVKVWSLDKVEDRYGNDYTVSYVRNVTSGELYPKRINYSPSSAVVFQYQDRVGSIRWGKELGNTFKQTKILKSIQTYIDVIDESHADQGKLVREYSISHELSASTDRELVSSIQECGFNESGTKVCARPLEFEWQEGEFGFESDSYSVELCDGSSFPHDVKSGYYNDIDGDGYTDLIQDNMVAAWGTESCFEPTYFERYNASNGTYVMKSMSFVQGASGKRGISVRHHQKTNPTFEVHLADFIKGESQPLYTHLAEFPYSTQRIDQPSILVEDFNNDGLQDFIIGVYKNTSTWIQNVDGTFEKLTMETQGYAERQPVFADVNGDGIEDLLSIAVGNFRVNGVIEEDWAVSRIYTGHGDSFGSPYGEGVSVNQSPYAKLSGETWYYRAFGPIGSGYRVLADLNGDKLLDLVHQDNVDRMPQEWWVRYGTGEHDIQNAFSSPQKIDVLAAQMNHAADIDLNRQFGIGFDYDKDGNQDLILFPRNENAFKVFLSRNIGGEVTYKALSGNAFPTQEPALAYGTGIKGDVNNDGIPDLVGIKGINVNLGKVGKPDILAKVKNGLGAVSEIAYSTLDNSTNNGKPVYTVSEKPAEFPLIEAKRRMHVVKSLRHSSGVQSVPWVTTYFNYTGAKFDVQGRGFVGFEKVEETHPSTSNVFIKQYKQEYPFQGLVEKITHSSGSGDLISITEQEYETHPENDRFVYLKKTLKKDYHLLTTNVDDPIAVTKTTNTYDSCGNLTNQYSIVGSGFAGIMVTGDVSSKNVSHDFINTLDADCSNDFLSESSIIQYESGTANPISEKIQYTPNAQFDVETTTRYPGTSIELVTTTNRNDKGVVTSQSQQAVDIDDGVTGLRVERFEDFEDEVYPKTIVNAEGHTVYLEYDTRFGSPKEKLDANGLITEYFYDALGRNSKVLEPDDTETTFVSYFCESAPVACPSKAVYLVATKVTNLNSVGTYGAPLTISYYDDRQREVLTEAYNFNGEVIKTETQYFYNGRVYKISEPYTGYASYWTTYGGYDSVGRPKTITNPAGVKKTTAYSKDGVNLKVVNEYRIPSPQGLVTQTKASYLNAPVMLFVPKMLNLLQYNIPMMQKGI